MTSINLRVLVTHILSFGGLLLAGMLAAPLTAVAEDSPLFVPSTYQLAPEDVVEIAVWKEEGLQKQLLVKPDGSISFPLIGDIQASGKTTEQIKTEVTDRLKTYIPNPVVTVSVLKIVGYKVYVLGRVNRPGEIVAGRYVTVLQALSMAGGLTPFAEEDNIKVIRRTNGKETVFPFHYARIRKGNDLDLNIVLKSGDIVLVP
jgi:polysaccharide export outer membrane protein